MSALLPLAAPSVRSTSTKIHAHRRRGKIETKTDRERENEKDGNTIKTGAFYAVFTISKKYFVLSALRMKEVQALLVVRFSFAPCSCTPFPISNLSGRPPKYKRSGRHVTVPKHNRHVFPPLHPLCRAGSRSPQKCTSTKHTRVRVSRPTPPQYRDS